MLHCLPLSGEQDTNYEFAFRSDPGLTLANLRLAWVSLLDLYLTPSGSTVKTTPAVVVRGAKSGFGAFSLAPGAGAWAASAGGECPQGVGGVVLCNSHFTAAAISAGTQPVCGVYIGCRNNDLQRYGVINAAERDAGDCRVPCERLLPCRGTGRLPELLLPNHRRRPAVGVVLQGGSS